MGEIGALKHHQSLFYENIIAEIDVGIRQLEGKHDADVAGAEVDGESVKQDLSREILRGGQPKSRQEMSSRMATESLTTLKTRPAVSFSALLFMFHPL